MFAQNRRMWHDDAVIHNPTIAVLGAGPAGLAAAELLAPHAHVVVFDRMQSVGRKFLMAGRGGLNLTHAEDIELFRTRYGTARPALLAAIDGFTPAMLRDWVHGLGQETYVGTSGRVFPRAMKASPLLRAWLARLAGLGVEFRTRMEWAGWEGDALRFSDGTLFRADATVLALGGASWPRLGATGRWAHVLGDDMAPFKPSNMGFRVAWSPHLLSRYAGAPLKRIAAVFDGRTARGEAVITAEGIEGGAIYALSGPLRDAIEADGSALLHLDLRPDLDFATLAARLPATRSGMSIANLLRVRAGLSPALSALVQETLHGDGAGADLATTIKALPIRLLAPFSLDRAISSAGGLRFDALDDHFMLRAHPSVFAAGEMLDWEAPTGGYLLQACLSTGRAAALGVLHWLETHD